MPIVRCEQNTSEWLHWRCGRITASRMGDVVSKRKRGTGELAIREKYRMDLVCERLTGKVAEHVVTPAMDHGHESEPRARAAYEIGTGAMIEQVGFIIHENMYFSGASPDSLVEEDGGLEVKAPNTSTHVEWMIEGIVPEKHRPQMYWNMACSGREWWDFLSFDDRLPEGIRAFVCRLDRDEKIIAEMEYAAMEFNAEIEAICEKLCPGFKWAPKMPQARLSAPERTEDFIGDLMAAMDGADSTEGNLIP